MSVAERFRDGAEEKNSGLNDETCAHSFSPSRNPPSSFCASPLSPKSPRHSANWWQRRLAELVLEHALQVSDVELRRQEASAAGGRPGGGILGGLGEAKPEGVPQAFEVSLGVVDALPQRVESGHVKQSLGLLWVHSMLSGVG